MTLSTRTGISLNQGRTSKLGLTQGSARRRRANALIVAAASPYPNTPDAVHPPSAGESQPVLPDACSGQAGSSWCRNCRVRPAVSYHGRCQPCEDAFADLWLSYGRGELDIDPDPGLVM